MIARKRHSYRMHYDWIHCRRCRIYNWWASR